MLEYLAELWEATPDKKRYYDAISLSDIAVECHRYGMKHPNCAQVLAMPDLTGLLHRIPRESQWWLLPGSLGILAAEEDAGMLGNTSGISGDVVTLTQSQIWLPRTWKRVLGMPPTHLVHVPIPRHLHPTRMMKTWLRRHRVGGRGRENVRSTLHPPSNALRGARRWITQ